MNVAFDTWVLNARFRNSGITLYALAMLEEFARVSAERPDLWVTAFTGQGGLHDTGSVTEHANFRLKRTPALDEFRMWRLFGLFREAKRASADVIFVPNAQVLPKLSALPVVCTIHDLTPIKTPWQMDRRMTFMLKMFLRFAAKDATRIMTDSEASKKDIVEVYGIDPEKVRVAYLGINRVLFNLDRPDEQRLNSLKQRFQLSRPYLYHHGTVQPRKNLDALIRAHHLLLERHPSLQLDLVLAGPLGWLYEQTVALGKSSGNGRGKVVFTGALSGEELAILLKGSSMGVFPTLYEGFCFPMVESMACGIPTIASNVSCLPEVSGGVLRYFDPMSTEDMADAIEKVLNDTAERGRMVSAGLARAAQFSWRKTAEETLDVLAEAARRR